MDTRFFGNMMEKMKDAFLAARAAGEDASSALRQARRLLLECARPLRPANAPRVTRMSPRGLRWARGRRHHYRVRGVRISGELRRGIDLHAAGKFPAGRMKSC